MKKSLLFFLIFTLVSFTSLHKYYISLTEIKLNKKNQSIELIMNVFMDDIEVALKDEFKIDPKIATKQENKLLGTYFFKYLKKHFSIKIDNITKDYKFIGKEYDGNIVYFYLEITNIANVKNIEIKNTVLTKNFSEQQNLIKIEIENQRKSLFLTKEKDKGLLNF